MEPQIVRLKTLSSARRRRVLVYALIAVVIAAFAFWHLSTNVLPFDAVRWAGGSPRLRFRMKDSLVAKYQAGKFPTREIVDQVLGPDDDRSDGPEHRHFDLLEWYGNPWYLRILFDDRGNVVAFSAQPS
jgi:hypothetical protein